MTSLLIGLTPTSATLVVALLNTLWQGVVLFAVVWVALHLVRMVNATTRYAIWLASLVSVLLLPLVNMGLASWDYPADRHSSQLELKHSNEVSFESDPVVVTRPRAAFPDPRTESIPGMERPLPLRRVDTYELISVDDTRRTKSLFPLHIGPGVWASGLVIGWLVAVTFMLSRVVWSYRFLNRLKEKSIAIPERLERRLEHWCQLGASKRSVELRCSKHIKGPVAAGLTRPVVLLPCHLVEELSEQELDQVGLHEMAHICRWDDWTNLLQKVVEAILFFHPAVHWIGGQLDAEREIACDDWVIYRTGRPKPYAACLTRLIELTGRVKAPVLAPGGFTTKQQIARRIEMSLEQTHQTKPRISKMSLFIGILVLMAAGIQSARTLPLVAAQAKTEAAVPEKETPQAETPLVEPIAVGDEESPLDEEQPARKESVQAEKETETRLRAEAEEQRRLMAILEQEAKERQRATEAEIEARFRAEAEERKQLSAIREQEAIDRRRALYAELAGQEGKERLAREMLGQTPERERALLLAETPEAVFFSEAPIVPFGLLEGRRATLPEDELITLMTDIASSDPDSEVRKAAIRSIGRLGSEAASDALVRLYDSQEDIALRKTVLSSLGWSRKSNPRVLGKLKNIASSDPNPELRKAALLGLAGLPGDDGVSALISIYDHTQEADLKKFIIRYLSQGRSKEALEKLMDIARSDTDASLRLEAVRSLGSVHGGPMIGYADAPVLAEPYLSTLPVPAPEPPEPPAPPKEKKD